MSGELKSNVVGGKFGGVVTPGSLLATSFSMAEGMRTAVVVAIGKDDQIRVGMTTGSMSEILGMLRVAEAEIVDRMREPMR